MTQEHFSLNHWVHHCSCALLNKWQSIALCTVTSHERGSAILTMSAKVGFGTLVRRASQLWKVRFLVTLLLPRKAVGGSSYVYH
jgi:hypothetical protein